MWTGRGMAFKLVGLLAASALPSVFSRNLTNSQLLAVENNLATGAQLPWELGTRAQALLELYVPSYSVLTPSATLPPPQKVSASIRNSAAWINTMTIAQSVVANRSRSNGFVVGPQPLIADTAAADPASIGVAVLLANWTGGVDGLGDGLDYATAAKDQLNYLLHVVPHTADGAISHRLEQVQLWSDFIYMVPPFLAYYGVVTDNRTLILQAYTQISLYRKYLRDTTAHNLWKHVLLGTLRTDTPNDPGHWATGNAWAAAGMLRVLQTIQNSKYSNSFTSQRTNLVNWVVEIQTGMYRNLDSTHIFKNYPDRPLSTTNFYDSSSTALMASTVYRLSTIRGINTYISLAQKSRMALCTMNATTGVLPHFTTDGWLTPVVNPDWYSVQGSHSPESQAFVLEMQAAWRDWVAA